MPHDFDGGYTEEPFRTLVCEYPGPDVYTADQFRSEWGPIFHRGRLDGSARVLVIGQDPGQHEAILRRILIGEAGRRVQGFLARLGITKSYVMINAFLYSVYGSVRAETARDPRLVDYRNRWLDALLLGRRVEAVVALGTAADAAWQAWKATAAGAAYDAVHVHVTHPTQPESSSKGNASQLARATKQMLDGWNAALRVLSGALRQPDSPRPLALYADTWAAGDRPPIPERDFPPGLPGWMLEQDGWAARVGATAAAKRRNITLTVPKGILP
jgi:hypothetical protein